MSDNQNLIQFINSLRFNEKVNTILLIMFLAVVIVLTMKGYKNPAKDNGINDKAEEMVRDLSSSSINNDSVVIIPRN